MPDNHDVASTIARCRSLNNQIAEILKEQLAAEESKVRRYYLWWFLLGSLLAYRVENSSKFEVDTASAEEFLNTQKAVQTVLDQLSQNSAVIKVGGFISCVC